MNYTIQTPSPCTELFAYVYPDELQPPTMVSGPLEGSESDIVERYAAAPWALQDLEYRPWDGAGDPGATCLAWSPGATEVFVAYEDPDTGQMVGTARDVGIQ